MIEKNLPPVVTGVGAMRELLDAEQPELDSLERELSRIVDEFFVDSMSVRTITFWEELLGLPHTGALTLNERRGIVAARLRAHSPMTPNALLEQVRAFGVEGRIEEYFDIPAARVWFLGNLPQRLNALINQLEETRPFHVPLSFGCQIDFEGNARVGMVNTSLLDITIRPHKPSLPEFFGKSKLYAHVSVIINIRISAARA